MTDALLIYMIIGILMTAVYPADKVRDLAARNGRGKATAIWLASVATFAVLWLPLLLWSAVKR